MFKSFWKLTEKKRKKACFSEKYFFQFFNRTQLILEIFQKF